MSLDLVLLGGTGFVGSAIVRHAAGDGSGSLRIRALVRGTPTRITAPGVTPITGELAAPPEALFPDRPFVAVHLATKQIDGDGTGFEAVNVSGTTRLLAALPAHCRGLIYGSSMSVYGQGAQRGIDEDTPCAPATPLARTRLAAEQRILSAAAERGIGAFVLRPRFILGRDDQHTLPALLKLFRRGLRPGRGTQQFSIIDVDDYAAIIVALARRIEARAASGEAVRCPLHVAYHRPVRLMEIRTALARRFALPRVRLAVPATTLVIDGLRRIPLARTAALATRMELIGRDHVADVGRLAEEIGERIVSRDPLDVLEHAVDLLRDGDR